MTYVAPSSQTPLTVWLDYISTTHIKTIDMTLERVKGVWARMGISPSCPVVTIGGTNGKGSTCAMLNSILCSGSFKVGVYTSPHIHDFNERIICNNQHVDDKTLTEAFAAIESVRQETPLTYFEWATLAAFWVFSQAELDIWVLEVGMGGRLDATNLLDADIAVITSIDLDHQAYLGDTRDAIGLEKLGIARANHPLILGDPSPPAAVIEAIAQRSIPLLQLGQHFGYVADTPQQWQYWIKTKEKTLKRRFGLPWPALRGDHQLANASIVLAILEQLSDRLAVSMQAVREGLLNVAWPGRFQVLPGQPITVLDVAHNPHAMRALAHNLEKMAFFPTTWCVWGMLSDKDARECAQILAPSVQQWAVCSVEGERARSAKEMKALLESLGVSSSCITCFNQPFEAFQWVKGQAQPADRIVVTGSFSILGNL